MQIRLRSVVFIVREGKVLVTRHNFSNNDFWVLPGGSVLPGETTAQAAVRELEAETGLILKSKRFLFTREHFNGNSHVVEFYFLGEVDPKQEPTLQKGSAISEVVFKTPEEIQQLIFYPKHVKGRLKDYIESNFLNIDPHKGLKE